MLISFTSAIALNTNFDSASLIGFLLRPNPSTAETLQCWIIISSGTADADADADAGDVLELATERIA